MKITILATDGSLLANNGSNAISILGSDGALLPNDGVNPVAMIVDEDGIKNQNDGAHTAYSILGTDGALKPYEEGNSYTILNEDGSIYLGAATEAAALAIIRNAGGYAYDFTNAATLSANFYYPPDEIPESSLVSENGDSVAQAFPLNPTGGAIFGPELFPQPTLDSATGLTLEAGWSITGGKAVGTAVTGSFYATDCLEVGKWYHARLHVDTHSAGALYYPYDGAGGNAFIRFQDGTEIGYATWTFKATATFANVYASGFTGSITEVRFREVTGPGFQPGTAPTWREEFGLEFDGVDDRLNGQSDWLKVFPNVTDREYEFGIAFAGTPITNDADVWKNSLLMGNSSGDVGLHLRTANGGEIYAYHYGDVAYEVDAPYTPGSEIVGWSRFKDNKIGLALEDGAYTETTVTAPYAIAGVPRMGNSYLALDANIVAMVLIPEAGILSEVDRAIVSAWLASKQGRTFGAGPTNWIPDNGDPTGENEAWYAFRLTLDDEILTPANGAKLYEYIESGSTASDRQLGSYVLPGSPETGSVKTKATVKAKGRDFVSLENGSFSYYYTAIFNLTTGEFVGWYDDGDEYYLDGTSASITEVETGVFELEIVTPAAGEYNYATVYSHIDVDYTPFAADPAKGIYVGGFVCEAV